jgi:hypothetical protein
MVIWDIEVFSTDLLVISKLIEMTKLSLKAKILTLMTKGFFFFFLYIHNDCFCYYIKYNTIKIKKWLVCATNTLECLTNSP